MGARDVELGGKEGGALDYVSFGSTVCLPKNQLNQIGYVIE